MGRRSIEAMDVLVETRRGRVRGLAEEGLAVFRWIPYARPPVGPRRFGPPEPPEAWTGTHDATRFGPSAPQNGALIGPIMSLGIGRTSEDRSEEHTSELQSQSNLVCRLLLEKKKKKK